MIDTAFQSGVNRELKKFFKAKKQGFLKIDARSGVLIDQIADLTLRGGDRIRPYFCWVGYQVAGGNEMKDILPALLALELFQSFALIHDDIMDHATTRRGGLTIHAYFTQNPRTQAQAGSFALLAGDLCAQWAQELMDRLSLDVSRQSAKTTFHSMVEEVICGQTVEMWGMKLENKSEILRMYEMKTASYCVEKPLIMGAILGGANQALIRALSQFGRRVGLAFQLKDDILGVFGNFIRLGKSTSNDITEGKWTYMMALTYQKSNTHDKRKLLTLLANKVTDVEDIGWVKRKIEVSGAKVSTEAKMRTLITQAKDQLAKSKLVENKLLYMLADWVIRRDD